MLDICSRCGQQLNTPGSTTTIASSELSGSLLSDDPAKHTVDGHSGTVVYEHSLLTTYKIGGVS